MRVACCQHLHHFAVCGFPITWIIQVDFRWYALSYKLADDCHGRSVSTLTGHTSKHNVAGLS